MRLQNLYIMPIDEARCLNKNVDRETCSNHGDRRRRSRKRTPYASLRRAHLLQTYLVMKPEGSNDVDVVMPRWTVRRV